MWTRRQWLALKNTIGFAGATFIPLEVHLAIQPDFLVWKVAILRLRGAWCGPMPQAALSWPQEVR